MIAHADTMPKPLGSAFIQCNLQMGAHVLAQCVSYHQVRLYSPPLSARCPDIFTAAHDVEQMDRGRAQRRRLGEHRRTHP